MKEIFEEFVRRQLSPLLTNNTGFKKSGANTFKKNSTDVCLLITIEPDRFNYPERYGFNILLHLIGLKPGIKPSDGLKSIIKNGNILIATINIKDILNKAPLPYELKENNQDVLIAEIQTDIEDERVKNWLYISSVNEAEAIITMPANNKFIYNMAVYFAVAGDKEKSRQYFMQIKSQGNIVFQAASSLGIDLS